MSKNNTENQNGTAATSSAYSNAIAPYRIKQAVSFTKISALSTKTYNDRFLKLYNTELEIYHEKDRQKREKPDKLKTVQSL